MASILAMHYLRLSAIVSETAVKATSAHKSTTVSVASPTSEANNSIETAEFEEVSMNRR